MSLLLQYVQPVLIISTNTTFILNCPVKMWKNKNLTDYLFNKWWTLTVPKLLLAPLLSWLFRACRLPVSFCLCCGIFCLTDSSDEKCQTWLPPEPTHLWPWPYQPWPRQRNQFPRFLSGLFWLLGWGMRGGGFVYQLFPLPCLLTNCSSGCFCRAEWALRMEQYGVAKRVHISAFLPCWIKSIGSDNAHPEQTLTCFSALSQT